MELIQLDATCSMYELTGCDESRFISKDVFNTLIENLEKTRYGGRICIIANTNRKPFFFCDAYDNPLSQLKRLGFKKVHSYIGHGGRKVRVMMKNINLDAL